MRPPSLLTISLAALSFCTACQVPPQTRPQAKRDLVSALIAHNDDGIAAQLARQQRDRAHPSFGGIPSAQGLYHAGSASGFIRNLVAAYVAPSSRYANSSEVLAALDAAATFMLSVQHPDGTIDLLTTNFHSPPDTGFVLEWMCAAATVLRKAQQPAANPPLDKLLDKLLTFIQRGADALAVGGIHTPNHRWVVCMALARANALVPDPRYVERIETWLAENIDIDPDGQFTERSTSIYSPLTDRCLITVARLLNRPELLEPVRRNLEMTLYYLHPDGQIATEGSRRQDQYRRSSVLRYYYPYRFMALHDGDTRFSAVVQQIERDQFARLTGQLIFFLEAAELAAPLPAASPLPTDFEQHFAHSDLVRIRRGDLSATILEDNATFFSLHVGGATVVMRFASAFFGKGQFVGSGLRKEGPAWVLKQDLVGPYYQPIAEALRRRDGNWHKMDRAQRATSEVQRLQSIVRVQEQPDGFDVELEVTGTDGVPLAIELGCPADTQIQGPAPLDPAVTAGSGGAGPRSFLWTAPETIFTVGPDRIRIRNGHVEHRWTQIRGALPKLPGKSVYVTGFTPLRHTLEFRK